MAPQRQRPTAPTWIAAAVIIVVIALLITACGGDDEETAGGSGGKAGKIALLLPESKTTRYETQDRPNFERRVQELCPGCEVFNQNADQDAAKQQRQVEAAITEGVDVMVLDPVDSASAASLAQRAKDRGIPVVSYDRLITDAPLDYYISFDNEEVGRLQAQSLVDELKDRGHGDGSIVMINGAPTDNNATLFKRGAHSVFDDASLKIAKEYDTPDWSPDAAQREMEQAIAAVGRNGFDGVYAANDGTAGGAIAALKGAGLDPGKYPVTGQDAERAAIQRILAGSQYMTVYKAIKAEAEAAAELSVALAKDDKPKAGLVTGKVDNGELQVPSVLLQPVAVTKDNVEDTVIKDGFWSVEQICTDRYADDCEAAGIS
jgi:D-xylose transport system substrate-binding protein